MIKNVIIKKILKGIFSPLLSIANKYLPKHDNNVLLYCANGGIEYCNAIIRDYLLRNGFDKKYRIYCGVKNMKYAEDNPKVSFVCGVSAIMVFLRTAHVFYTAGQLPIKPSKSQIVIHMQHGNADYKRMGASTNINNGDEFFFTYMIAPSELYIKSYADAYKCSEKNIVVAGDPMCDEMLNDPRDSYEFSRFKKMILWVPTFRQSDYLGYNDSNLKTLIPLFKEDCYGELNEKLKEWNIYLIVKLHPNQDAPVGLQRHFSHLSVYSHKEFNSSKYGVYKLMAQSDGLIGDYSSASMQYLLLDRPMAFVVPDIEEYGKTRGFVFEHPEDYMGGHIVKTKDEFYQFIDDFANDKDIYREKRHWVCNQIYKYHDANSCKRIVELSGMTLD